MFNWKLDLCKWKRFKYFPCYSHQSLTKYFDVDNDDSLWVTAIETERLSVSIEKELELLGVKNLIKY